MTSLFISQARLDLRRVAAVLHHDENRNDEAVANSIPHYLQHCPLRGRESNVAHPDGDERHAGQQKAK